MEEPMFPIVAEHLRAEKRKKYRREWMRKRRREKGLRITVSVSPSFHNRAKRYKPATYSERQWLRHLLILGLKQVEPTPKRHPPPWLLQ
jgi:hypothetical protein